MLKALFLVLALAASAAEPPGLFGRYLSWVLDYVPSSLVGTVDSIVTEVVGLGGDPNPYSYLDRNQRAVFRPVWTRATDFATDCAGEVDHARALNRAHTMMTASRSDAPDDYAPTEAFVEHFITDAEWGYRYGLLQATAGTAVWETYSNTKKTKSGEWYGVEPGLVGVWSQLKADFLGIAWGSSLPRSGARHDAAWDFLLRGNYAEFQAAVNRESDFWRLHKDKAAERRAGLCRDEPDARGFCCLKGWLPAEDCPDGPACAGGAPQPS